MSSMIAFDLDGTLIDNDAALRYAYKMAGVIMPDDVRNKGWRSWCPKHIHDLKHQYYPGALAMLGVRTPLFHFAVIEQAPILTGASQEAVETVMQVWGEHLNVIGTGLLAVRKAEMLMRMSPSGIYVDDSLQVLAVIKRMTSWKTMTPKQAIKHLGLK